jgi:DNA polymerase III epsilon subunit-like protein
MGNRIVFDLEANGLLYSGDTVHCIVAKDPETSKVWKFGPESIEDAVDLINSYRFAIGHFITGFDIPFLKIKMGLEITTTVRDTCVISKLFFPEQLSHSLNYYGRKFGRLKPEHENWEVFSEEMLHRCTEDVEINCLLYDYLIEVGLSNWDWIEAIELEQQFQLDQAYQELWGVDIDIQLAENLIANIDKEVEDLDRRLLEVLPKRCIDNGPVRKPFKKDGSYSQMVIDYLR